VGGAWAMIIVAALLFVAALIIGWDGLKAYRRYSARPAKPPATKPVLPPETHPHPSPA
jgi:hypothetical protein